MKKIVLVIEKNFWSSELKAENLKIQMGKIIGIYKHAGKIRKKPIPVAGKIAFLFLCFYEK